MVQPATKSSDIDRGRMAQGFLDALAGRGGQSGGAPWAADVEQLAAWTQALKLLGDVASKPSSGGERRESLADQPLSTILLRLRNLSASGVLVVRAGPVVNAMGIVSGRPVLNNSNVKRESLTSLLLSEGRVDAAFLEAHQSSAENLVASLLASGRMSPSDLAQLFRRQAERRWVDAFDYQNGTAEFVGVVSLPKVEPLLDADWLELVRKGLWRDKQLGVEVLNARMRRLLTPGLRLSVKEGAPDLSRELTVAEQAVFARLTQGVAALDLIAAAPGHGDEGKVAVMRSLYLFWQLGILEHSEQAVAAGKPAPITPKQPPPSRRESSTGPVRQPAAASVTSGSLPAAPSVPAGGPSAAAPAPSGAAALAEYKAQQRLETEAKECLFNYRVIEAVQKLEELAKRRGRAGGTLAYLGLAYLLRNGPGDEKRAQTQVEKAVAADERDAIAHAVHSRVLEQLGRKAEAALHQRRAMSMCEGNAVWTAEVERVLSVTAKPGQKRKAKKTAAETGGILPVLILLGVPIGLFLAVNVGHQGRTEYFYGWPDRFFLVRRGVLLVAGLVGLALTTRKGPIRMWRELGWKPSSTAMLVGLIWALPVGIFSPIQAVKPNLTIVLSLTLVHVVCEEIFFRGFALRLLLDRLFDHRLAIVLGAALYGFYHLSYYSFWVETPLVARFYWSALIALVAGVPYSMLYERTRSFLPPLLCHAVVALIMMWRSVIAAV